MNMIIKKAALGIAGSMLLASSLWSADKPTILTMHTFLSPKAPPYAKLLEPWAKQVEELSKGKIKIEMFPSMSMGGKPNELYKQSRDGVADIVYTVAGYTPGVFPRTEVLELPTVHTNSSLKTAMAAKDNFDLLKDDFTDVHPLVIAMAGPYQLSTVSKKVDSIDDVKGLKLRSPSRTGAWYISELGAEPVGMPLPAAPQALSKGAVDGAALPMEIFPAFKFQQLTKYTTEIKGGGGFGGSVLLLLMNKDKYNSLSQELKDVLDQTTGKDQIAKFAKLADDFEEIGKGLQVKSGGEIITLSEEETAKFDAAGERTVQKWVAEMKEKGIDGQKIVDSVKKSIANQ